MCTLFVSLGPAGILQASIAPFCVQERVASATGWKNQEIPLSTFIFLDNNFSAVVCQMLSVTHSIPWSREQTSTTSCTNLPYSHRLQDSDTENDLVKDLGQADHLGVYTSISAVNPLQTIYLRRAPSGGALGGFEWSVEKLVWLPTSTVLDDVLSIDHEVCLSC